MTIATVSYCSASGMLWLLTVTMMYDHRWHCDEHSIGEEGSLGKGWTSSDVADSESVADPEGAVYGRLAVVG